MKIKNLLYTSLVLIFTMSLVFAISFPHEFEGKIIVEDGTNPDGELLIGVLNGVTIGSTTINEEDYELILEDYLGVGGYVKFYIGEKKAEESFEYFDLGDTVTNLTFETIVPGVGACGNNVCDLNECSACPVDCNIAKCLDDSVCDAVVGENCLNSLNDCACASGSSCSNSGICESDNSGDNNNDGSSSSGGDTSTDNGFVPISYSDPNKNLKEKPFAGIDELNELEKQKEIDSIRPSGITGAIIGFAGSTGGVSLIFVVVVLIAGMIVIVKKRNVSKEEVAVLEK